MFKIDGVSGSPIVFEGYRITPGDAPNLNYQYGDSLNAAIMPLFDGVNRAEGTGMTMSSRKHIILRNIQITHYKAALYAYGAEYLTIDNIITMYTGDINAFYSGKGIVFALAYHNLIKNCIVVNASAEGITIVGDNNTVENSKVFCDEGTAYAATDYYFAIGGNYNHISGCYIERVGDLPHGGHGFNIKGDCEYNTVDNCTAVNMGNAFMVRHRGAKYNTFNNCRSIDGGGIVIRDGASYNTFSYCTMESGATGVYFLDTTEDEGAQYCGRYNLFENCIFKNNYYGIRFFYYSEISPADNNTFENCTFDNGTYLFETERPNYDNKMVNCIVSNFKTLIDPSTAHPTYPLDFSFTYTNFYNNGFPIPPGIGNFSLDPEGMIRVYITRTGEIVTLDIETEYLPFVVAAENAAAPWESMKAQAVASRTVAYYKLLNPSGDNFDIYDDERDQVYNPSLPLLDEHIRSVSETKGVHLKYADVIIFAFYVSGLDDYLQYVTFNEGKTGDDITQTTLGYTTDPPSLFPYNRGCMGQVQANDLAQNNGYTVDQILKYFYGADIIITPPLPTPVPGNLIQNPGFESGTTSWWIDPPTNVTFSTVSPGYEGNYAAKLDLSSGESVQLLQPGITLEPDTRYRLSFAAYSTTGHDIAVRLLKHISPYTIYGLNSTFNLGTNWQVFTIEFTTSGFTSIVNDGRLQFWLSPFAAAGDVYYIDDVRLEKVIVDTTPPTVTGNAPTGVNVPITTQINVAFSEAMNQTSAESAFSMSPATPGSFSWNSNSTIMTFTPASVLASDTIHVVTIGTGAMDLAGNVLQAPHSWQFTTAYLDTTPPTVTGNAPTGVNVPITTQINVAFSEAMNQTSAESAFSMSPATPGSFSWNSNSTIMTFTPASALASDTIYVVIIGTGAMDLAGNVLQAPHSWQFTTAYLDTTPPTVTGNAPTGVNVPITTQINVAFSEAMNQTSAESAFSMSPATPGSFSWNSNSTIMTFTPASVLASDTIYMVIIGTGAMDLAGNVLQAPHSWQFTTAYPDEPEPIPDRKRIRVYRPQTDEIVTLDIETEYLPFVVAAENAGAPLESMKSQAVASRTFAYYKKEHPSGADFDVYDNDRDQVYDPTLPLIDEHIRSVSETKSIILKYADVIIFAFHVSGLGDTEQFVTYNEGKSGDEITQTPLGYLTDPPILFPYNRGCMGQVQANALAEDDGYTTDEIIRYFYGEDIITASLEDTTVPSHGFESPWLLLLPMLPVAAFVITRKISRVK